ncbi:MAG TPA: phosphoribosylanthranilate isomerase [Dictyoglomaceae bacterium]|mgnify:CR=1 FL=1|nr:phosphoribosylanthranilate isomerase [Dictyoglomaceae bacterium]HOL39057.1 phosphoribosylanthranilate isomerase [Dictyoglomaceae bacterium]HOP94396.1 phosphoribosylanthranilate isomerase [Dictyoglomaceae bacterium]HPP15767.1 phosphoribosylanthranilate isomerase [Dictyoglomaceae bacterium]HPU42756.1 phosphoribosylanthranilate isomerase [Dictyoglomaceae bacterium]
MWVKICGITDIISAMHCEMEGIDAIGFVFVPWSFRYISLEKLDKMAPHLKRLSVMKIGVFADSSEEEIRDVMNILPLDGIQLHGEENIEFAKKFKEFFLIKAFGIDEKPLEELEEDILKFSSIGYVLLDRNRNSSLTFDEFIEKVSKLRSYSKVILAGGINEDNLPKVIPLKPFGIDLSSGVEEEKGKKSLVKITNFMRKVSDYENEKFS